MRTLRQFFLILWLSAPAHASVGPPTYLLAIANAESFDRQLPVLHYAHDDLTRLVKVMTRTGMVPERHVITAQDATRGQLKDAFAVLARRMHGERTAQPAKFIFFYTGHSDANGLHLADGLLTKSELHALIASVPAEARVAFFDGCYSGALAAKGVQPADDFVVPRAEFDEPTGSVFLAATSATDVAFEVEELKGSLFTHNLVGGLYGGADTNRDGLVTVDELYQYLYRQMSAFAVSLPIGRRQTPEYNVDLQGRGALVLSYIDRTTVPVEIDSTIVGDLTLTVDGGLQQFRLSKSARAPSRLRLVPGDYSVILRTGDQIGRGTLRVEPGRVKPEHSESDHVVALRRRDLRFERTQNLDLVAKGQRPQIRWGVAVGVTNGSLTRSGPSVELQTATPAVRIESSEWRLVGLFGGRQNDLQYREQTGTSHTASMLLGASASFYTGWSLPGQHWRFLAAWGADYFWQRWDDADAADPRRFEELIPKVSAGIGTAWTTRTGMVWGVNVRREFPFARDRRSGDVLAFGANVFSASLEW